VGILIDQIAISKAVANGRTVKAQMGETWALNNLHPSQMRYSDKISDLVSGYWPGAENLGAGRSQHMYPDNREFWDNGVVNSDENGREEIGFSQQADRTDWKFRDTQSETGLPPSG